MSSKLFDKIIKSQLTFNEKIKFKPKIINTDRFKFLILIEVIILLIKIFVKIKK